MLWITHRGNTLKDGHGMSFEMRRTSTMTTTDWRNKLYFGDNLDILRENVADETVDLIYLDPALNSVVQSVPLHLSSNPV